MYIDNETTLGITTSTQGRHTHTHSHTHTHTHTHKNKHTCDVVHTRTRLHEHKRLSVHVLPRNEDPQVVPQDTFYRLSLTQRDFTENYQSCTVGSDPSFYQAQVNKALSTAKQALTVLQSC